MDTRHGQNVEQARRVRQALATGRLSPAAFRSALCDVPAAARDAWVDDVFGLEAIADDDAGLPRGGVPYVPCSVAKLLDVVDTAEVGPSDVFVDIGAGAGRATALVHALTGAGGIGIEVQPALVRVAHELATRLNLPRSVVVQGDAAEIIGTVAIGTVFFLYCPFSGERLATVLGELEIIARTREIRICCVDLPIPPQRWLAPITSPASDVAVYRSASAAGAGCRSTTPERQRASNSPPVTFTKDD
jgi:SAM-dependent methyltransferase